MTDAQIYRCWLRILAYERYFPRVKLRGLARRQLLRVVAPLGMAR